MSKATPGGLVVGVEKASGYYHRVMSWFNSKSQALVVLVVFISYGGSTFGSRLPLHADRERIDEIVRRHQVEQHNHKFAEPELKHDLDVVSKSKTGSETQKDHSLPQNTLGINVIY